MSIASTSEAAIFERILLPRKPAMSKLAAQSILELGFAPEDQSRMHVLAEKARQGTLSADEEQEIDNYDRVGTIVSILHSKARQALKAKGNHASPASKPSKRLQTKSTRDVRAPGSVKRSSSESADTGKKTSPKRRRTGADS